MTIRSAVDPTGRPAAQEQVEEAYAARPSAYREHDAAEALVLKDGRPAATRTPLVRAVDLAAGESQTVALADGKTATVKLIGVDERRDPIRSAVREARSRSRSTARRSRCHRATTTCRSSAGGVQIDCPITGGYRTEQRRGSWGLDKDARLRLWPAGSPWIEPGTFLYPASQRWFASMTQMANEPVYVDGGEKPATAKIYYHYGLDIGGAEGLVEVVAATDGVVVSSGTRPAGRATRTRPARPRYDVVYLLDDRGWYYRYSHLQTSTRRSSPAAT